MASIGNEIKYYEFKKYRNFCFKYYPESCFICGEMGENERIEIHHINGDRSDNSITNLIPVCVSCHKKIHSHKEHGDVINWFTDQLDRLPHVRHAKKWSEKNIQIDPRKEKQIKNIINSATGPMGATVPMGGE